jgi:hypothetical protein
MRTDGCRNVSAEGEREREGEGEGEGGVDRGSIPQRPIEAHLEAKKARGSVSDTDPPSTSIPRGAPSSVSRGRKKVETRAAPSCLSAQGRRCSATRGAPSPSRAPPGGVRRMSMRSRPAMAAERVTIRVCVTANRGVGRVLSDAIARARDVASEPARRGVASADQARYAYASTRDGVKVCVYLRRCALVTGRVLESVEIYAKTWSRRPNYRPSPSTFGILRLGPMGRRAFQITRRADPTPALRHFIIGFKASFL